MGVLENANIYHTIFEFCSMPIAVFNRECLITLVNKEFAKLAGFTREEIEGKKEWTEFIRAEDLAPIGESVWDGNGGVSVSYQFEVPFYGGYGTVKAVLANIAILRGAEKGIAILVDISARKQAEESLRSAHRQLQDILEFLPDPTFVIDKQKRVIAWNQAIEALTGVPKEQMIGKGDYAYGKPFYGQPRQVLIDHLGNDLQVNQAGYENYTRKGGAVCGQVFAPKIRQGQGGYVWGIAAPLYDHNGQLVGAIETLRAITEQKLLEEQLKYLSLHDANLDIYNRAYFEQEMRRVEKGRLNSVGIIICDIDGLKVVNDTLGHNAGDAVLLAAARVIKKVFRENDVVARVGGDEFVAILPECDQDTVEQVCNRLKAAIREHNNHNPEIPLSISVVDQFYKTIDGSLAHLFGVVIVDRD
ncbi:MAG: diguanylate cyclase, partial [Heliobacteriaceae bacterium]|nr:diguanylate cyclase [Heliobacteriaceae bacterium]